MTSAFVAIGMMLTRIEVLITLVGCQITPRHPACSLKAAFWESSRLSLGQISVFFTRQDVSQ